MGIFYENYVKLCAEHDLSESGAAKKIGLSNAAANGWKNGKMPSATTQIKLANLFGISVKELMGKTNDLSAGIKKDPIPKDGAVSQEKQPPPVMPVGATGIVMVGEPSFKLIFFIPFVDSKDLSQSWPRF